MLDRLRHLTRDFKAFPRQYWVLTFGLFVYVGAAALGFPYESIYLHRDLGVSMTVVGLVFGLVPLAVVPLQFLGGHIVDRIGRRPVIIGSVIVGASWFVGFAFVTEVWQVALLVAVENAFGWPLYMTAANAMVADLVAPERRQEAFSISRVAMNVGVVLGPAAGGFALEWGADFRELFLAAAVGCFVMMWMMVAWIKESRPVTVVAPRRAAGGRKEAGFRVVAADRNFLIFCLVAVLPVFCIGNFGSIYSVYITDYLHLPYGNWGMLLALNAFVVATVQYPLVRATRFRNRMVLLAISSALLALGIGGSAFAGPLWSLVVLVVVMSIGETLLSPVTTAEVSDCAPEAVRGRYMSVWTVVWNGGAALGPAFSGWAMDAFGGRQAFAILLVEGMVGAVCFLLLAPGWRRRRQSAAKPTA